MGGGAFRGRIGRLQVDVRVNDGRLGVSALGVYGEYEVGLWAGGP